MVNPVICFITESVHNLDMRNFGDSTVIGVPTCHGAQYRMHNNKLVNAKYLKMFPDVRKLFFSFVRFSALE